MTDSRQEQPCPSPDCSGSDCCGAEQGATAGRGRRRAIFIVIVLAAVGVAAHSLLTRPSGASVGCGAADVQAAVASLEGVSAALAGHDALFVILPDMDDDAAAQVAGPVAAATASLQAKGVRVGSLTLSREDLEFVQAADAFAVDTFPAVVALTKGWGRAVVQGKITEASLLRAYAEACAPAGGSGSCSP